MLPADSLSFGHVADFVGGFTSEVRTFGSSLQRGRIGAATVAAAVALTACLPTDGETSGTLSGAAQPSAATVTVPLVAIASPANAARLVAAAPRGRIPADGIVLRALPGRDDAGAGISSYIFEVGRNVEPRESVWTSEPTRVEASIGFAVARLDAELDEDTAFRWRVRPASDDDSSWSEWAYFTTTGPAYRVDGGANNGSERAELINDRAGSYQAGDRPYVPISGAPDSGQEASGLTASRQYEDVYWFIRDNKPNDDRAALYAIAVDPNTGLLGLVDGWPTVEYPVVGAENVDWETLEVTADGSIWIGDTGSFFEQQSHSRPNFQLHRIPEPDPTDVSAVPPVVETILYTFPDGASRNAEAMFSAGDELYIVTKEPGKQAVYRVPKASGELTLIGAIGAALPSITGAAMSDDQTRIALTTAARQLFVFTADESGGEPDEIVRRLLVDNPSPTWTRHYRVAAELADAGQPRTGTQEFTRETMQVEGVAFRPGSHDIVSIAEFGDHVLFTPAATYEQHPVG